MTAEEDGAAIYFKDLDDSFTLSDSRFTCKDSSLYVKSTIRSELENSIAIPNAGAIYVKNGGSNIIDSDDNTFEYCFNSD